MPRLSQETLAIISVGIGLAALVLTSTAGIRGEIQTIRGEIQTVRGEIQTVRGEIQTVRTEARADREAFQIHIIRLTEQQGILGGQVKGIRDQLATTR